MHIRPATADDAIGMSVVLRSLTAAGLRTRPDSPEFALQNYIAPADGILCSVAESEAGAILGLQSLKRASPGNPYRVTSGWGIIGTHISPDAARQGIGKALFVATLDAARDAGLTDIDATIGADNVQGLAYYEAMGFRNYRRMEGAVCKRFTLSGTSHERSVSREA